MRNLILQNYSVRKYNQLLRRFQSVSLTRYIMQMFEEGSNDSIAMAVANQIKQRTIDKACEWLRENMEYWLGDYNLAEDELEENQLHYSAMIEELCKAMEN